MNEYKVKGLSCGNCAQGLERQIRHLEYGETASLNFNSGKLKIDPRISLERVKTILKSDGAYLEEASLPPHPDSGETHPHHHDHADAGRGMLRMLIFSGVLYAAALIIDGSVTPLLPIMLYMTATVISGYKTFARGVRNLLSLKFTIDTLMTIALTGAVLIGEWKEAALVAILFGVNELLEGKGMEKARHSMESLLDAAPKLASRIDGGIESVVPVASLAAGETVIVRPGGQIPSDGTILNGNSSVNEAAITGESLPVDKQPGETVYGGSINNEGLLTIRIDKAYQDSSLAKILHLVEEAQETKTPIELFINRFAKYYTPLIIFIAALVITVPPLFLNGEWEFWLYQGLAVLIVGCPCALILASPVAIISGITRNAKNGILIKGGVFLEQLGRIDTLAFDKTGTLTKGLPEVMETVAYDEARFYTAAASIEFASSHPLAKAIVKSISDLGIRFQPPEEIETIPGQGVIAFINGTRYWLGNEALIQHAELNEEQIRQIGLLKSRGLTLVLLADERRLLGMFGLADEIRSESKEVIKSLHKRGIRRTVILSGDHQSTVDQVAKAVGVTDAYGRLLPEMKARVIVELSKTGQVAMIGDGMNDAPALASAQLGIAMGKGSDTAIETADVVLMQDHLGKLPESISIARRVNRIIRFNIAFALGLKLIALLLTIPGMLTLWIAILSDMGATVIVTLVSLSILLFHKDG